MIIISLQARSICTPVKLVTIYNLYLIHNLIIIDLSVFHSILKSFFQPIIKQSSQINWLFSGNQVSLTGLKLVKTDSDLPIWNTWTALERFTELHYELTDPHSITQQRLARASMYQNNCPVYFANERQRFCERTKNRPTTAELPSMQSMAEMTHPMTNLKTVP